MPHPDQRRGELRGARAQPRIVGAINIAFASLADDLDTRVEARGMLDQRRNQERAILHQAKHSRNPPSRGHGSSKFALPARARTICDARGDVKAIPSRRDIFTSVNSHARGEGRHLA
jgi:hypothetical protein